MGTEIISILELLEAIELELGELSFSEILSGNEITIGITAIAAIGTYIANSINNNNHQTTNYQRSINNYDKVSQLYINNYLSKIANINTSPQTYSSSQLKLMEAFFTNDMSNINVYVEKATLIKTNMKAIADRINSLKVNGKTFSIRHSPYIETMYGIQTHISQFIIANNGSTYSTTSELETMGIIKSGTIVENITISHSSGIGHITHETTYGIISGLETTLTESQVGTIFDKIVEAINTLIEQANALLEKVWKNTISIVGDITQPNPTLENIVDTINELEVLEKNGLLSQELNRILEWLRSILGSRTLTKNWDDKEGTEKYKPKRKPRKPKKHKKPKEKKKKKIRKIKEISFNTARTSRWIKEVRFVFPRYTDYRSDEKGSLYFVLKNPVNVREIRYKRVKRGTFSAIVMWNTGSKLGVGYRYWSQFNKHRIVNKNVLSYSLKRINKENRETAILGEIKNRKVKYK